MSRMYQVTKEIHFCYGHRLLDYNGKCMHPHGHNARVEIELSTANLDSRGMVVDFGDLQAAIKTWIDREFDHKMILCRRHPWTKALADLGEPYYPIDENPTAENIARLIYEYAASQGFPVSAVRLWETPTSFATYGRA